MKEERKIDERRKKGRTGEKKKEREERENS